MLGPGLGPCPLFRIFNDMINTHSDPIDREGRAMMPQKSSNVWMKHLMMIERSLKHLRLLLLIKSIILESLKGTCIFSLNFNFDCFLLPFLTNASHKKFRNFSLTIYHTSKTHSHSFIILEQIVFWGIRLLNKCICCHFTDDFFSLRTLFYFNLKIYFFCCSSYFDFAK